MKLFLINRNQLKRWLGWGLILFSFLILIDWNWQLYTEQSTQGAYIKLLTSITPGTTRKGVEEMYTSSFEPKPTIYTTKDMTRIKLGKSFKYIWRYNGSVNNVIVPDDGYILFYDSYFVNEKCIFGLSLPPYMNGTPIDFAVVFNNENRVVAIVFIEHYSP